MISAVANLTDLEVLTLTLWGEGRGEPVEGRIGIACAIRNRVGADLGHDGKPDWWGEGYRGVCLAPAQFSCWNQNDPNRPRLDELAVEMVAGQLTTDPLLRECQWVAAGVIDGIVRERVGIATHYYASAMKTPPAWSVGARLVARVGGHLFFSGVR